MIYLFSFLTASAVPLAVAGYGGHLAAKVFDTRQRYLQNPQPQMSTHELAKAAAKMVEGSKVVEGSRVKSQRLKSKAEATR